MDRLMRAAKLVDIRRFGLFDEEEPTPGPGEALVRSEEVGICGSDVHYFRDGAIGDSEVVFPFTLGHETAGVIEALGPSVSGPPVGTRVAIEPGISCGACKWCLRGDPNLCTHIRFHGSPPVEGTLRERFTHPARLCVRLDDKLTMDDGVMLEPLAIGVHAVRLMHLEPGASVVVVGCGPVGLMTLAVAAISGADRIIAADRLAYRLELAERYGATHLVHADREDIVAEANRITHGRGVDVVFEASSSPEVPAQAVSMAAPGGAIALIGIPSTGTIALDPHTARRKGLTVKWVRRSKLAVEPAMRFVTSGRIPLRGLVTHHIPLADVQAGFEMVEAYRDQVFKAVVLPNG